MLDEYLLNGWMDRWMDELLLQNYLEIIVHWKVIQKQHYSGGSHVSPRSLRGQPRKQREKQLARAQREAPPAVVLFISGPCSLTRCHVSEYSGPGSASQGTNEG